MRMAKYSGERLLQIFERTHGDCHICGRRLCFGNYAALSEKGAWEVEHSRPRAMGGSERLNNLYAAHIRCNRQKGARSTRSARAEWGRTRAPYSAKRKEAIRSANAWGGAALGAAAGSAFGPPGMLLGGLLGAVFGNSQPPAR